MNLAISSLRGRLIAPYQHDGVKWMIDREMAPSTKGGFLCDEMGLGKTIQVIATMLGNPGLQTLIVVPKSIVTQWAEELKRFAPSLTVNVFDGPNRILVPSSVTIAPYSVMVEKSKLKGTPTVLHSVNWGRVVLDEGHEIRNINSKIYASCKNLTSPIRWILSGTPVYNSIKDFVALCGFVGIHRSMVQGLSQKIRETYVIRRTKESLAHINKRLELPPCDFQNVELDLFPEEREFYRKVFEESKNRVKEILSHDNSGLEFLNMLECFLRVRQTLIYPQLYLNGKATKQDTEPDQWLYPTNKMETLFTMIGEHPKEKSLVFCQFTEEMNHIQRELKMRRHTVFRIDGSVEQSDRVEQIARFKKSPGGVFIIQIKAGGQGLNLQEATRVYITSPSWNPATEIQAIARSHRTGQTQKVIVRKLVYKGTEELPSIEESIMELQKHKAIVSSQVLNDPTLAEQIPVSSTLNIRALTKIFDC
jgi:SNF2 family DNA or RNA helicase